MSDNPLANLTLEQKRGLKTYLDQHRDVPFDALCMDVSRHLCVNVTAEQLTCFYIDCQFS